MIGIVLMMIPSQETQVSAGQPDTAETLTFGALMIAALVAPLVALLLHALFPIVPWLSWGDAVWMIPGWLVACTLIAGALMLPITVLGWILAYLLKPFRSLSSRPAESFLVSQAGMFAAFAFWVGTTAGGSIYILWKAARHSFLAFT